MAQEAINLNDSQKVALILSHQFSLVGEWQLNNASGAARVFGKDKGYDLSSEEDLPLPPNLDRFRISTDLKFRNGDSSYTVITKKVLHPIKRQDDLFFSFVTEIDGENYTTVLMDGQLMVIRMYKDWSWTRRYKRVN